MVPISEMLQHGFMVRALIAGVITAAIAGSVGLFLVLRRLSLIADTLAHVALAGVSIGVIAGIAPAWSTLIFAIGGALGIEELRVRGRMHGEAALAVFLSGSLALAVVLMSFGGVSGSDFMRYLFGSIVTVSRQDVWMMVILGGLAGLVVALFFKELFYLALDEEMARASGLPASWLNAVFTVLTAVGVAIGIRIVGVLLIGALMVIPAVTALQLRVGFKASFIYTMLFGQISVLAGLYLAYIFGLPAGGTIVLVALVLLAGTAVGVALRSHFRDEDVTSLMEPVGGHQSTGLSG